MGGACSSATGVAEDDVQLERARAAAVAIALPAVLCRATSSTVSSGTVDGEYLGEVLDVCHQLDSSLRCDFDRIGLVAFVLADPVATSTRTAIVAATRNHFDEALLGAAVVAIAQAQLNEDCGALRSAVALQQRMVAASSPRALLATAMEDQMESDYAMQIRATGLVSGAFETIGAPRHRVRAMHYLSSRDVLACAAACRVMASWAPRFLTTWHAPRRATDALVLRVATRFPYLAEAALDGCLWVTDAAVVALAAGCTALTSVSLFNCCRITNRAVNALSDRCGALASLSLYKCAAVTNASLVTLAARCAALRSIDLSYCVRVGDDALVALAAGCPQLRRVNLSGCAVRDVAVSALAAHCARLASISLDGCDAITDGAMRALAECSELRRVNVLRCAGVTEAAVAALVAACPLLERSAVKASSAPRSNGRKFQHTASATNRPFVTLGGKNHGARFI